MARDRWSPAWLLGSLALGGATVVVPLALLARGGGAVSLGLLAGVVALAGLSGVVIVGGLADGSRTHRSAVLLAFALAGLALVVVSVSETTTVLFVAAGLLWFAAGGLGSTLTVLVAAGEPPSRWSERLAVQAVYGAWGWAGGLALGFVWTGVVGAGLDAPLALRSLSLVLAAAAFGGLFLGWRDGPADGDAAEANRAATLARAVVDRRVLPVRSATVPFLSGQEYWLARAFGLGRLLGREDGSLSRTLPITAGVYAGAGIFWGLLPFYLVVDLGFTSGQVFAVFLLATLGAGLVTRRVGRLTVAGDALALWRGSLLVLAVLLVVVGLVGPVVATGSFASVCLLGLVIGCTWALVFVSGTAVVRERSPADRRSTILGRHTILGVVAAGLGAVAGGWLTSVGATLTTSGFTVTAATAGAVVLAGAVGTLRLDESASAAADSDALEDPIERSTVLDDGD